MEMSDYYKETVNLLKEIEFCMDYFKEIDKNKVKKVIKIINYLLDEKQDYETYCQWQKFHDCDDVYDIHYLKNSLSLF